MDDTGAPVVKIDARWSPQNVYVIDGKALSLDGFVKRSITGCNATRKLHFWKLKNINKDAGCDGVRLAEPHPGKRCPIDMTATCLFPHATEPGLRLERAGDRLSVMPANLTESSTASKSL
jgi:hypothetical protein